VVKRIAARLPQSGTPICDRGLLNLRRYRICLLTVGGDDDRDLAGPGERGGQQDVDLVEAGYWDWGAIRD
jgi:hypothetical protein